MLEELVVPAVLAVSAVPSTITAAVALLHATQRGGAPPPPPPPPPPPAPAAEEAPLLLLAPLFGSPVREPVAHHHVPRKRELRRAVNGVLALPAAQHVEHEGGVGGVRRAAAMASSAAAYRNW